MGAEAINILGSKLGKNMIPLSLTGTEKTVHGKGPEPDPLYYMPYIHVMEYYAALKMNCLINTAIHMDSQT